MCPWRTYLLPFKRYPKAAADSRTARTHFAENSYDILALLIALKYFVSPLRYDRLLKRIDFALHEKLKKRLHSIDITEVKRIMGLNCDWLKLK